jgi:nicotinamide mononucleotide (NMN) deamidase PncC
MWNATYTQTGVAVTGVNGSTNGAIPPNGGTVNFGFNVTYSTGNNKPTYFLLNGIPCQTDLPNVTQVVTPPTVTAIP